MVDVSAIIKSPEIRDVIAAAYCLGEEEARNNIFFCNKEDLLEFLSTQAEEYGELEEKQPGINFVDFAVKNAKKYFPF